MIPLFPHTLDKKIILQPILTSDAEKFLRFVSENRAYLQAYDRFVRDFQTLEQVVTYLKKIQAFRDKGKTLTCGIWNDNQIIGYFTCGLSEEGAQVGYGLAKAYEGNGIITNTASYILNYAFQELHISSARLTCWIDNKRSIAVAERLGFKREKGLIPANPAQDIFHAQYKYILEPSTR